eukprot:UN31081
MALWSVEDVQGWLRTKPFFHLYSEAFRRHNINGAELLKLEENFMIESLGVKKFFHRVLLLRDIADCLQPFKIPTADGGTPYSRFLRFQTQDMVMWCKSLTFTRNTSYPTIMHKQKLQEKYLLQ